jgi:hypothetical protein
MQQQYPESLGEFKHLPNLVQSCNISGEILNGDGYAKTIELGKAGQCYKYVNLVRNGMVNELKQCGLSSEVLEALDKANFFEIGQVARAWPTRFSKTSGITKKVIEEIKAKFDIEGIKASLEGGKK